MINDDHLGKRLFNNKKEIIQPELDSRFKILTIKNYRSLNLPFPFYPLLYYLLYLYVITVSLCTKQEYVLCHEAFI